MCQANKMKKPLSPLKMMASLNFLFQFVCLEDLVTSMSDLYPSFFFTGHRRKMLLLAISLLCFGVGLFLVTEVSTGSIPALQLSKYGLSVRVCANQPLCVNQPLCSASLRCRQDFVCFSSLTTTPAAGSQWSSSPFWRQFASDGCTVSNSWEAVIWLGRKITLSVAEVNFDQAVSQQQTCLTAAWQQNVYISLLYFKHTSFLF